ncbi:MAG: stage II sporulation protein P [Clostridia bacterium]|nr:stage II sporulation protein P [Clostridia bacterium]
MNRTKRWYILLTGLTVLVFSLALLSYIQDRWQIPASSVLKVFNLSWDEHTSGEYTILVDEQGQVLDMMARRVYLNDEFIAADNWRYRVIRIEGNRAICHKLKLEQVSFSEAELTALADTEIPVQGRGNQTIGLYYTHDGESYVPTEGTENIPGKGGILRVGSVFAEKLRNLGLNIIDDKTSHAPHDDAAYRRSRRTAISLIKQGAAAIFDVHRDGVPDPDFYRQVINNQKVTKVRLVVGRQNQNMNSNLDYAKRIKAVADQRYPGLIQGIFIGSGSFNQDLSPRSMLLEVGTHTNSREEAERGVKLFADIVPPVLGSVSRPAAAQTASSSADWTSVLLIILAFAIGAGAYLFISAGSWDKALARLKQFSSIEWVNLMGWSRTGKQKFLGLLVRQSKRSQPGPLKTERSRDKERNGNAGNK